MSWLKHLLGIKNEAEIVAEVEVQPTVREARRAIARADRILNELEIIELRRKPYARRAGDRG